MSYVLGYVIVAWATAVFFTSTKTGKAIAGEHHSDGCAVMFVAFLWPVFYFLLSIDLVARRSK